MRNGILFYLDDDNNPVSISAVEVTESRVVAYKEHALQKKARRLARIACEAIVDDVVIAAEGN